MAEPAISRWQPRGAWTGIVTEGHFGRPDSVGATVDVWESAAIATVIARDRGRTDLATAIETTVGLRMPSRLCVAFTPTHSLAWSGPNRWTLVARERTGFAETLTTLSAFAAVSDQSDGRAVLRLSGPNIRDVLSKGCMIDVHPRAFPIGATATSAIAHMGVQFWRTDDGPNGPVFDLLVARSMAGSFWSWLSASAAEFGCDVAVRR